MMHPGHHKNFTGICLHVNVCWLPVVAFLILFLFPLHLFSQAPAWLWAKRTGGTSIDYTTDVAADAFGNSYITGNYWSAPITFGTTTLTNSGLNDVFLVKYDAAGNVIWARKAGNTGSDVGQSVATDAAGNIYIAGSFSASVTFGTTTLTSAGSSDIFVAKYDSAGNVLWAKRAGSTGNDGASSIAVTPAGDVYIGGNYTSSAITFGPNTLPNFGYNDAFVARYNTAGTALWGKHIGEYLDEFVSSLATDAAGNVLAAGIYNSIDVLIGSTVIITNAQDAVDDIYLAKFDAAGNVLWARGAGGWEGDYAYGVATDAGGNVYMTGFVVSNPSNFGSLSITTGAFALYLAKYNSAGTIQWVVSPGFGAGLSVTTDVCGDIYWTGDFGGSITFGSTTLPQSGGGDIFIAKYNASGSPLWAMKAGGTNYETGQSITLSTPSSELLVAGQYQSPSIAFGPVTLTNVSVDGFVSRIGLTCSLVPLPVELLSFTAVPVDNNKVKLNWITATEINCDFFAVERSLDAHEWKHVMKVEGHGTSSTVLEYETWDHTPYWGISYYRLKQADYNGQFYYSDMEAVRITADGEPLLSPNPATDFIYMFSPDENSNREADIVNVLGETVLRSKNQNKIDISYLSNGIYFLRAKTGESLTTQKFIKL